MGGFKSFAFASAAIALAGIVFASSNSRSDGVDIGISDRQSSSGTEPSARINIAGEISILNRDLPPFLLFSVL
jgi:hypothetical protein